MGCACNKNKGGRKTASPGLRRQVSAAANPLLRSPVANAGLNGPAPVAQTDRQRINRIRAAAIRQQFGH